MAADWVLCETQPCTSKSPSAEKKQIKTSPANCYNNNASCGREAGLSAHSWKLWGEEERDKMRLLHYSMVWGLWGAWRGHAWLSSLPWVPCAGALGSEEFLLSACRLLIFSQDYPRNFLVLELISLSGGRGYSRYGHILCLLSLVKKKSFEFSEAFECVSDYCSKNWAAASVPIPSVISIKGCKSIANVPSLLAPFVSGENPLVEDLSGSGRKIAEEAFGSHFLQWVRACFMLEHFKHSTGSSWRYQVFHSQSYS